MNGNENNLKLRVFWLVPLAESRYRHQAPYADVSETLVLKGAQKRQEMAKRSQK